MNSEFQEIESIDGIIVDLRYAGTNNFTRKNIYGSFHRAYLHKEARHKLVSAAEHLTQRFPKHKFIIFDALRPRWAQTILFSFVEGTSQEPFVADPNEGSVHSYGFALDISILGPDGKELDMGSKFDDFSELSAPRSESRFEANGRLSAQHIQNRKILRQCMEGAGFIQNPIEWWHFDARPIGELKNRYPMFNDV